MVYKLTEEGRKYLEKGLPEKNLVKLLDISTGKSVSISQATKRIKNFPIALKWSLEREWVSKKDDKLTLLKIPDRIEEEKALKKIHKGEKVEEEILKILISRSLVIKVTETYKKTEEEIKKSGNVIGELNHDIIITGLWKNRKFKPVEVEVVRKKPKKKKIILGKRQPYNHFLLQVRQKLVELGFNEMTGPMIETEFWNFDALFQPQNHPARDWTMTFSLSNPKYGNIPPVSKKVKARHEKSWKYRWNPKVAMQLMPRAHGTSLSARTLGEKPEIPGKYFAIARCFRPDVIDVRHFLEFNQVEGIVLDESLTFKSLLGILKMFAIEIAGAEEVKFIPDYYPFTEPSAQLSAKHPQLGWIEFGGSGIFREEVTEPLGIDVPVLAWGLGIDRLAMFKLNINDIRDLFSKNLEWLRSQK